MLCMHPIPALCETSHPSHALQSIRSVLTDLGVWLSFVEAHARHTPVGAGSAGHGVAAKSTATMVPHSHWADLTGQVHSMATTASIQARDKVSQCACCLKAQVHPSFFAALSLQLRPY